MTLRAIYPGLARLRLTEDDLTALAKQGSVCQEPHRGKVRFKLRFRAGRSSGRPLRPDPHG